MAKKTKKTTTRTAARKRPPATTKPAAKKKPAAKPRTTRTRPATVAMVPAPALVVDEAHPTDLVLMLERLALADIDTAKLKEMVEVVRGVRADDAKAAFNAAFSKMRDQIPVIPRRGIIRNKQGQEQSRYPLLEDIQDAVLPVLSRWGFSLAHRTEWPDPLAGEQRMMLIVGVLSHENGHEKESTFLTVADETGSKNKVQALRSAISYGRRSTTMDVLNLTSRGEDDDGQRAGELEKELKKKTKATRSRYQNMEPPGTINGDAREQLAAAMKVHNVRLVDFKKYLKDTFGYVSRSQILNSQFTKVLGWLQCPDAVEGEVVE